ncbi:hypothetical protein M758_UG254300 [Ceratodon purpureus]|nr:hypothetical protein M758_UG254300 [Ceratodon purpureus]
MLQGHVRWVLLFLSTTALSHDSNFLSRSLTLVAESNRRRPSITRLYATAARS